MINQIGVVVGTLQGSIPCAPFSTVWDTNVKRRNKLWQEREWLQEQLRRQQQRL